MTLRAALLGCGWIGSEFRTDSAAGIYNHAAAYQACPETQLVAICDQDPVKLQRAGERWQVDARFSDAAELMAKTQPEIVSVCTPDATHYALIKMALETPSVRAILAEKPLAMELAQAQELAALAKRRGVALAVNYSRRYSLGHTELRDRIRSGEFGRIVTVGGFYTKGTLHNGTHWFDLARMLVDEIVRVTGFNLLDESGADPTFDAILRFAGGASGHLQAFDASAGTLFEMDLMGTKGRVRVIEPAGHFAISRVTESETYPGYRVFGPDEILPARNSDTVLHAVEDLVRCVREGATPRCSGDDGVAAVQVGHAIRHSVKSGEPVSVQNHA